MFTRHGKKQADNVLKVDLAALLQGAYRTRERLEDPGHGRPERLHFCAEIIVDHGCIHAHVRGDFTDRSGGKSLRGEQSFCSMQYLLPKIVAGRRSRTSPRALSPVFYGICHDEINHVPALWSLIY